MKTVHITNYYHKNSGGISTSYNALMAAAARHKREVRLIVPGETRTVEEVNDFAKIYYVPAQYSPLFDKRYRVMMPWQYMVSDSIIRQILLEEMPDLIEVTDKYTLSILGAMVRTGNFKRLGRPILVHFSCERMDDNVASFLTGGRSGKWFARRLMGNYNLPSFDYHIANSAYTAEEFFEAVRPAENPRRSARFMNLCWRFLKAPRVGLDSRVFVCPRGVDEEHFSPDRRSRSFREKMRAAAGLPDDALILLYAGRISPEKNVSLLADLMFLLADDTRRDFRLLVAGDGPQREKLQADGEVRAPGRIHFLGHLGKDELADHYANADIFVHPNPKEPFGIAPLEAMASGVPTLAPNAGGILSYATNENAWLVPPTAFHFADAVREIVSDDALRERKVENALVTARANTRQASTDRLFATYDRIYEDFHSRKELFTDNAAASEFDYFGKVVKQLSDQSGDA